jgi:protein SCO1/2
VKHLLITVCALVGAAGLTAQDQDLFRPPRPTTLPPALRNVGVDQKLNHSINLDLTFRDDSGRTVALREYFGKKPVILAPVYFECPMLCTQILSGLVSSLKPLDLTPGNEFDVVAFSFAPGETAELAAAKKASYIARYDRPQSAPGWHFLTGDEAGIRALMEQVGFRYQWDEKSKQWAHASTLILLTPEGKISRYLYGVDYSPRDLKFGLIEASKHQIGTAVEQVLLFCYHYDPTTGKYTPLALFSMRTLAATMVLGLGTFLIVMFRRDAREGRLGR